VPTASYEVRVSFREMDRPRLMQAQAVHSDGTPALDVILQLAVDDNGSLDDDRPVFALEVVTGVGGTAYFRWWRWPPEARPRDLTSVITARWDSVAVDVWLQDLYE
jgi:hypothetical protein